MKSVIAFMPVASVSVPFAFFVCKAAWDGQSIRPDFLRAYARLFGVVLSLALAALTSSEWMSVLTLVLGKFL